MSIYERPTKSLMADWAKEHLSKGQTFKKSAAVQWFEEHYPKIKSNTVNMHVEGMSVNNPVRKHHPSIRRRPTIIASGIGWRGPTRHGGRSMPPGLTPPDLFRGWARHPRLAVLIAMSVDRAPARSMTGSR